MNLDSQWLFPLSALENTPTEASLQKEMYDRARGVEFLFRLGASAAMPSDAMFTAATWFHRFYMRFPMEDYHRQEIAAACIFLVTKTDECGRKLKDIARMYLAKLNNTQLHDTQSESKDLEEAQVRILKAEEALLEALCFDFVVDITHTSLAELFEAKEVDPTVQEHAWSISHDSYRTPLCILYPPQIIAAACFILAQKYVEGEESPSIDHRISWPLPSDTLPTPPSHQPPSPDASRSALEHFGFGSEELSQVAGALDILIEFYASQNAEALPYLGVSSIPRPTSAPSRPRLYDSTNQMTTGSSQEQSQKLIQPSPHPGHTPISTNGHLTPSSIEKPKEES